MARPHRPSYFPSRKCWRFKLNGVQKYICKGIPPDERPARDGIPRRVWDEMDRLIREHEDRSRAGSDPTLFFLAQRYLVWLRDESVAGRITAKQFHNRRSQISHVVADPVIRDIRPVALTAEVADTFFARFRGEPLGEGLGPPSGHYVHNVGGAFRAMLRWAVRPVAGRSPARLIAANPLDGYSFPRLPGAVRGYVDARVIRRFLRWAWSRARWATNDRGGPGGYRPDRSRGLRPPPPTLASLKRRFDRIFVLMLRFQRLTGCRPGEACGLRWSEISPPPVPGVPWNPVLITVWPGRVKTRHQTDRARKIFVTPPVARILRTLERLEGRHPEVVFPHMRGTNAAARGHGDPLAGEPWPDGSAASAKLRLLRLAAIAEGLPGVEGAGPTKLVAYANRHGFASEASSHGFSDAQVAEQMGNTPDVMRRVYAHSIHEDAERRAHEIAAARRKRKKA